MAKQFWGNYFCAIVFLVFLAPEARSAVAGRTVVTPNVQAAEQAMTALKQRNPARYQKIIGTRERDPNLFSKLVLQVVREEKRLSFLKKNFPENYGLQQTMWNNRDKLAELLKEFKTDSSATNQSLVENQIAKILGEQYDLRAQMRKNRMKHYELRLAKMRKAVEEQSDRAVFVESLKTKLLAESPSKTE